MHFSISIAKQFVLRDKVLSKKVLVEVVAKEYN